MSWLFVDRLNIDPDNYVRFINRTAKSQFHGLIGTVKAMRNLAEDFGRPFLKGQAAATALFSPGLTVPPFPANRKIAS